MLRFSVRFFFNDTATTEIYTLSLHDALPICEGERRAPERPRLHAGRDLPVMLRQEPRQVPWDRRRRLEDRKSTPPNSSHGYISYARLCLKKKKKRRRRRRGRVMRGLGITTNQ